MPWLPCRISARRLSEGVTEVFFHTASKRAYSEIAARQWAWRLRRSCVIASLCCFTFRALAQLPLKMRLLGSITTGLTQGRGRIAIGLLALVRVTEYRMRS